MEIFNRCNRTELSQFLRQALSSSDANAFYQNRNFAFSVPPTQAAILVPFVLVNQQWSLLFIRRSISNDPHSGQVAFPGGRIEDSDSSPEMASLRESKEEIGLSPEDVELVGKLPPLLTVTNYQIQPIVGIVPYPYPFHPSPSEVQKIFTIPLHWLANPANYQVEDRQLPLPVGKVSTIYYKPYQDEVLWGASAQIVHILLKLIKTQASSLRDEA
ncbi:MAG: CoA pyrophosphatase [Anaerolineae bacterium]|jgi:8-oxo-dGTP pyrophosphatase MutT (NUDIX family)|nr:MAG: CoA pyrophosphatase [Anaerolineae bacterium]